MNKKFVLPVIVSAQGRDVEQLSGGPATSPSRKFKERIQESVKDTLIDADALQHAVTAAVELFEGVIDATATSNRIQVESLSFQMAVSATGKVGLLGTGVDVQAEATFEVTFKLEDLSGAMGHVQPP